MHNNFFDAKLFQKFHKVLNINKGNILKSANIYFKENFYKEDQIKCFEFFSSNNKILIDDTKIIKYFNKISNI